MHQIRQNVIAAGEISYSSIDKMSEISHGSYRPGQTKCLSSYFKGV
jgi:hypothetical protein